MGKLVRALLSLFICLLFEGSFNIMDDIIKKDRVKLNIETYEGLAIIKSHLKATERTAYIEDQRCIEEFVSVAL